MRFDNVRISQGKFEGNITLETLKTIVDLNNEKLLCDGVISKLKLALQTQDIKSDTKKSDETKNTSSSIDLSVLKSELFNDLSSEEIYKLLRMELNQVDDVLNLIEFSNQSRDLGIGFKWLNALDKSILEKVIRFIETTKNPDVLIEHIEVIGSFMKSVGHKTYAINHRRKNELIFKLLQFYWSNNLESLDYFEIKRLFDKQNKFVEKVFIEVCKKQPRLYYKACYDYELQN
jgi:hypothetical protein